jgi:hypothetical protein
LAENVNGSLLRDEIRIKLTKDHFWLGMGNKDIPHQIALFGHRAMVRK